MEFIPDNKKHLLLYIIITGFLFYLLSAALSSIFIIAVPQDSDWCLDRINIQVSENEYGTKCVEFKNNFEMLKYEHNQSMVNRNKHLILFIFSLAFLLTSLFFYFIPKWKKRHLDQDIFSHFFTIAVIAFVTTVIMPLIFSWVLPAPASWFPRIFSDINEAQVKEVLRKLN